MPGWTRSLLLALAVNAIFPVAGANDDVRSEESPHLNEVLSELSPVSLPDGAWSAYSLCLMDSLSGLQGHRDISLQMLVTYIKTFDDHGSDFPSDVAYRLDREVISPCVEYNPMVEISRQMHTSRSN